MTPGIAKQQEPSEEAAAKGVMALLQCSHSDLDSYSPWLMDGYKDDVRRVFIAMSVLSTPPAAQQAVPLTDEMVTAAARALNKRQAEACGVDKNDHWKFYGDDIKEDAKAALEAAHGITEKGQP